MIKIDPIISINKPSEDYELIDSGDGEKLERWGKYITRRPDPQALWSKTLPEIDWLKNTSASFDKNDKGANWKIKKDLPDSWVISLNNLSFKIKPTPFKHVGIFPEQNDNWSWMMGKIKDSKRGDLQVLNLFGYTGGASMACASVGAYVTHVDSSRSAITWANENIKLSSLENKPVRWILDDVREFVNKELKRGKKYDAIIMDPPAFGHGVKKELWKIEEDLPDLLEKCFNLLSDKPIFFLINGYSSGYSSVSYLNNLLPLVNKYKGELEHGELVIQESSGKRLLPCGIFSRWGMK